MKKVMFLFLILVSALTACAKKPIVVPVATAVTSSHLIVYSFSINWGQNELRTPPMFRYRTVDGWQMIPVPMSSGSVTIQGASGFQWGASILPFAGGYPQSTEVSASYDGAVLASSSAVGLDPCAVEGVIP